MWSCYDMLVVSHGFLLQAAEGSWFFFHTLETTQQPVKYTCVDYEKRKSVQSNLVLTKILLDHIHM